jgi:hypothetical protein
MGKGQHIARRAALWRSQRRRRACLAAGGHARTLNRAQRAHCPPVCDACGKEGSGKAQMSAKRQVWGLCAWRLPDVASRPCGAGRRQQRRRREAAQGRTGVASGSVSRLAIPQGGAGDRVGAVSAPALRRRRPSGAGRAAEREEGGKGRQGRGGGASRARRRRGWGRAEALRGGAAAARGPRCGSQKSWEAKKRARHACLAGPGAEGRAWKRGRGAGLLR